MILLPWLPAQLWPCIPGGTGSLGAPLAPVGCRWISWHWGVYGCFELEEMLQGRRITAAEGSLVAWDVATESGSLPKTNKQKQQDQGMCLKSSPLKFQIFISWLNDFTGYSEHNFLFPVPLNEIFGWHGWLNLALLILKRLFLTIKSKDQNHPFICINPSPGWH